MDNTDVTQQFTASRGLAFTTKVGSIVTGACYYWLY